MNPQIGATAFLSGYLVLFLLGVGGIGFIELVVGGLVTWGAVLLIINYPKPK